jgi:hypothetical protein
LLGSDEIGKFNMMYGLNGSSSNSVNFKKIMDDIDEDCDFKAEDEDQ